MVATVIQLCIAHCKSGSLSQLSDTLIHYNIRKCGFVLVTSFSSLSVSKAVHSGCSQIHRTARIKKFQNQRVRNPVPSPHSSNHRLAALPCCHSRTSSMSLQTSFCASGSANFSSQVCLLRLVAAGALYWEVAAGALY
jgi:hypothetical protein